MTPEEVLNLFKRRNKNLRNNPPADIPERLKRQATEIERNEVAIKALEKQIPKKPILDTIFPSGVKWYLCPACKHNNIEKNDNYCHNCGQALDWSVEE
jgi:hypothetical protein